MKKTILVITLLASLHFAGTAGAAILTFDQGQLLSFTSSPNSFTVNIGTSFSPSEPGYWFQPASQAGAYYEILGYNFTVGANASTLGIGGTSGYTSLDLTVTNWNDQTWGFSVFADLTTGHVETPMQHISAEPNPLLKPGDAYGFSLQLDPNYVIGAGDKFGVHVVKSEFDLAHFEVVPEPGTLLLLGTGLIGVAIMRKSNFFRG